MKDDAQSISDNLSVEHASSDSSSFTRLSEVKIGGIVDLAWLQTDLRQGDSFLPLPVRAGVTSGRAYLTVQELTLELATWQVLVRFKLDNAILRPRSRRTIRIQEGSVASESVMTTTLLTVREQQHELEQPRRKQRGRSRETKTIRNVPQIALVSPFGEGMSIGDSDYGDPLRLNGLLSGEYANDGEPLFYLDPIDPKLPVRVSLITSIPFEKLHISATTRNKESSARQEVRDRSSEVVRQYEQLRRQMLAEELKVRIGRSQVRAELPFREGEFAIMIETFETYPNNTGGRGGAEDR